MKFPTLYQTLGLALCLGFTGCANFHQMPNFSHYYSAVTPLAKAPIPLLEQGVTGISKPAILHSNGTFDLKNAIPVRNLQIQHHYTTLGTYNFGGGRAVTPQDLAHMTAKMGGDYYYHVYWHAGTGSAVRMVMTGFTTPSVVSSTSQASAYGNYSGNYQNNYGGYGSLNGNANSYGYGSSQTVVGGSSSYQAVPFQYPIFENVVYVLASPQRQQKLIQMGAVTQDTLDHFSLVERIKRGETPAALK